MSGLNDDLGVVTIQGTCTTCHDTPHAGDHSVPAPLRIGTDDPAPVGGLDASGLPLYTLRNKTTAEMKVTTDPGRALVTGRWKECGVAVESLGLEPTGLPYFAVADPRGSTRL